MTPELYEKVWTDKRYRTVAPGEQLAYRFVELVKPDSKVIDFGSGTGRGAALIHALANVPVLALDFASNSMDYDVKGLSGIEFRQNDLRNSLNDREAFGYCTDVLEHIAPEDVDKVLVNILTAARKVFFAISTEKDHFGPVLAGEPLHLTVEDAYWWHEKLTKLGARVDWSEMTPHSVMFVASAYLNGDDIAEKSGMNADDERLKDNIRKNLELGLQEVCPHEAQPDLIVNLLAGGPSLADFEDEIVAAGKAGELFVTVNGTYKWLLDRGVIPAAHIMVDAREFNKRFVEKTYPQTKFLVSSQAAHEAVSALPKEQVFMFHSGDNELVREVFDAYCNDHGVNKEWFPVFGGSTVVSRGLVALAMLGFRRIRVYGWDSCLREGKHHAYDQKENDGQQVLEIHVGGRKFLCNPWMAVAAHEIQPLVSKVLGQIDGFELDVKGDGLIAHIFKHAAEMAERGSENGG